MPIRVRKTLLSILFILVATSLSAKKITISFWHILGYHVKEVIEEMVDEYNKKHPDVYVKPDFQGFYEDAQIKMLAAAITGHLPDVAQVPFEFLQPYIDNGFIEPINEEIPGEIKADIMEKMWRLVERDGKIFGLPFSINTNVLIYNENAYRSSGLNPDSPPSTWEEMIEMGKKLTLDTNGDGKTDIYAVTFYLGGIYGILPILWANGGSFLTDDGKRVNLTSPEMEKTIAMVHDLISTHSIMPRRWTDWESAQAFLTGKIAMVWFINAGISFSELNLPWPVRIAHIPYINGRREAILTGTALVNFAKSRKQRRAVRDFTFWLTSMENDIRLYETIGFVPIRHSSLNSLELKAFARENPNYRVPLEVIEYARPIPNHKDFFKINHEMGQMLQRIILNEADPELELARTERRINDLID